MSTNASDNQQPLSLTHTLHLLAPLSPPSNTRSWLSAPHPSLPLLATCSSDRSVRIYSLRTFRLHSTIEGGHKRSIRTCAWKPTPTSSSSNGKSNNETGGGGESVLVTGSFDASAGVWKRWNEGVIGQSVLDHNSNNRRDEEGDEDEDEDSDDGWRFAVILEGHDSEIKSVAWSCAGNFLATCSRDKSVWIWEDINDHDAGGMSGEGAMIGAGRLGGGGGTGEDDYETVAVLQDHEADVKCVVWHPHDNRFLASASYDETIRLYREDEDEGDWLCVAVLRGHGGTVWFIDFEGINYARRRRLKEGRTQAARGEYERSGGQEEARLISCSDDLTIRIWRRQRGTSSSSDIEDSTNGVEHKKTKNKYPSTFKPNSHSSSEEEWIQESILPQRHDQAIYCVNWSKRSGRVVSTGGDGRIIVYEERCVDHISDEANEANDRDDDDEDAKKEKENHNGTLDVMMDIEKKEEEDRTSDGKQKKKKRKEWFVIAEKEAAHGVYEINHVCWTKRFDDGRRENSKKPKSNSKANNEDQDDVEDREEEDEEEEEVIISTGDDGVVNIWTLDLEQVQSPVEEGNELAGGFNANGVEVGDVMDVS
ncbi:MAG: hypothetical protein M1823_001458 [Watsoniomyces obsoletus]|nr:MAG: hypothetical protein M1823_001458 [Watsoniomyces obsoletus]